MRNSCVAQVTQRAWWHNKKEIQKEGNISVHIADLLNCIAEADSAL